MTDTAIIGRHIEVLQANAGGESSSAFSFGAVVAGALVATAVTFILLSLGAGIGFLGASPFSSGPSAQTLTIIGAIWLVFAQAWGYACGGYLAGRLRPLAYSGSPDETNFRDGAHGVAAWALGVVLTVTMISLGAAVGVSTTAQVGATLGAGAAMGGGAAAGARPDATGYYVDTLFRTAPSSAGTPAARASSPAATTPTTPAAGNPQGETPPQMRAQQAGATDADRAQVTRIFASGLRDGSLSDEDRAHLGRLVSARTGLSPEEATRRVNEMIAQVNQTAKAAADKAAKAAAYFSLWTFIALLFGAMAALIGAIVGGNQRDENLARG